MSAEPPSNPRAETPPPAANDAPTEPAPAGREPAPAERPPTEPAGAAPTEPAPTAASGEARTEPSPAGSGRPGWRSTRFWVIGGVILLLVLAIVAVGISLSLSEDEDDPGDPGPGAADPDDHTVSAPIDGRDEAELHLVSGANVVTVRTEDMAGTLYEVSTPPDASTVPRTVDRDERIEVHLAETGETGPSSVEIVLSTEVRWTTLRFSGGANEQVVDLTGGAVGEVDFAAGASHIELTLPEPEGTVPVRLGAGAGDFTINAPPDVPVQVTLHSGAGRVEIDGDSQSGIGPETVFTPDDWEDAEDRYDIDCSGVGTLTLTRT